jgi:hypothetical protein
MKLAIELLGGASLGVPSLGVFVEPQGAFTPSPRHASFSAYNRLGHASTTFRPNGHNASTLSLKACTPNGMPTMVRHNTSPATR